MKRQNLAQVAHLAIDINTYEIIAVKLSASNVTNDECYLIYSNSPAKKSMKYQPMVNGACDTKQSYETVRIKRAVSFISPRKGATF
ncbi:hypothetical protein BTN50_2044 [Candidatus Enterovibrio altilux]|uniref:Mobile element protein n=1 Tax=Candidatus Enterovibrio altilux TaxID=1927128 RepID=A0A291BBT8_9GAMM|nr:hypothetical protein BTN50_2044 [Candidatus Enterovibrio luxaltus]